jgi:hypothetical protein
MAVKVNLKKYLAIDGRWQFVPVLKVDGRPQTGTVLIDGVPKKGTHGTFYLDWRENGKRIQKPCGVSPREALDAWRERMAILGGTIEEPEPELETLSPIHISVEDACKACLAQVTAQVAPHICDKPKSPTILRNSEDDSSCQTKAVLNVCCAVGKLRTKPVCLNRANSEMTREAQVHASAHLQGEGVIVRHRSSIGRKVAVEAMGFANEPLAEDG